MILKYLIEKEFKQFLRNSFMPKMAIIFPAAIMLIFPWATTMDVNNIHLTIVDQDVSTASQRLAEKISESSYFILQNRTNNYQTALSDVEHGKSDIILNIPIHFERDLTKIHSSTLQISANAVNALKGSIGSGYLGSIINEFSAEWTSQHGISAQAPFHIVVNDMYNPSLNFRHFMIPALMTMVLIMMTGFLPALNIVSEKEIGTIEQINVTPISKISFILSKLIPYWLMGFLILSVCFLLSWLVYGYTPQGSFFTIYLAATLFILVMSGIGLVVSNYSATMQQALFVMFFFIMVFILMSGLFTDIRSMPDWAQCIAFFNPPRYFISIMRSVYLRGSGIMNNWMNFGILTVFGLFVNVWAVISYRKQQ